MTYSLTVSIPIVEIIGKRSMNILLRYRSVRLHFLVHLRLNPGGVLPVLYTT